MYKPNNKYSVQAEETQTGIFLLFPDPISTTESFYILSSTKERKLNAATHCVDAFLIFFEFLNLMSQNRFHYILLVPIDSTKIHNLKKHLRYTVGVIALNDVIYLVRSRMTPS
jgi:hypothetical protein